jgi:hypothetical protein
MSFRFRVEKAWHDRQQHVYHVIGLLQEGVILPPVTAKVLGRPGETVRIDSMALGGPLPKAQLTFIAGHMTLEPQVLEGCLLSDA